MFSSKNVKSLGKILLIFFKGFVSYGTLNDKGLSLIMSRLERRARAFVLEDAHFERIDHSFFVVRSKWRERKTEDRRLNRE